MVELSTFSSPNFDPPMIKFVSDEVYGSQSLILTKAEIDPVTCCYCEPWI